MSKAAATASRPTSNSRLAQTPRRFSSVVLLAVGLALTYGCTGGLSCGGGGCGGGYDFPQTAASVPNGTTFVDDGIRMRLTQQALDTIAQNIRPILGELLGNDPNNPDILRIVQPGGTDLGGGFSIGQGPDESRPTEVVINIAELADSMQLEFVGDDAGEPTGIRLVASNVPVGMDARIFFAVDVLGFEATAACDLFGTNDGIGGRPFVSTVSIDALITPRVGSGAECDNNAPECLKIDVTINSAEIGDFGSGDIELDKPPSPCPNDGTGPCSEECSDEVFAVDSDGDNECIGVCAVGDIFVDIAAGLFDLLSGIVNSALPGLLETQLRSALDDFDGSPIAASGRLNLASLVPGVFPEAAHDLGYAVGPTAGAFRVNDPAQTADAQGMDLVFKSGFEAAPGLDTVDVPHPCVVPLSGADFAAYYDGFQFETPDAEPLTGVYNGQVYALGLSVAEASVNQALFGMYNSGALCIETNTDAVYGLTDGGFALTAGMLDALTGGRLRQFAKPDAPVVVALTPTLPPRITLGEGTEADGHLVVDWPGVEVSFYVMMNERFSRVFAVSAHIGMGLSVFNDAQTQTLRLSVVDGPTVDEFTETYNELLPDVEFSEVLESLIGSVFDAAIGDSLAFDYNIGTVLSEALGVPLFVNFLGIETLPEATRDFLNVYLALSNTPASALTQAQPLAFALADDNELVEAGHDRVLGHPTGRVALAVEGLQPARRYFVRVDFGAPRGPIAVDVDGVVRVADPKLRLLGKHRIALLAEGSMTEQAVLDAWVDVEAPRVTLVQVQDRILADAVDDATPSADVLVQWQLDDGEWSAPSHDVARRLDDIDARRLAVRAVDAVGNVSKSTSIDVRIARARVDEEMAAIDGGCAQPSGRRGAFSLVMSVAVIGAMVWRRLRRRSLEKRSFERRPSNQDAA